MISSLMSLCPLLGWLFKALAWLVVHGKVNTNDKLQLRRTNPFVLSGAFYAKEMENRLTTFFFIVLYLLGFGTNSSI